MKVMVCTGPVTYAGRDAVQTDIANLRAALDAPPRRPVEAFLPSTSPSGFGRNEYYANEQDYLAAVAEALREEYLAIVDVGLPAAGRRPVADRAPDGGPARPGRPAPPGASEHVEALNHALRGIPADRIRLHTCYGLNHGPRAARRGLLADVVPVMLQINAGAYSFEVGNPRHQHEWRIWARRPLPEGKILMPGLARPRAPTTSSTPSSSPTGSCLRGPGRPRERHRERGLRVLLARLFPPEVHPTVVWAKFAALAEGAAIATKRLWGGN